jgi:hypothetical protein
MAEPFGLFVVDGPKAFQKETALFMNLKFNPGRAPLFVGKKNTGSSSQGMTAKDPGNFQKQYNSRITWDFQFQPVPSRN